MTRHARSCCLGIVLCCLLGLGMAQAAEAAGVLYNGGPVSHSMSGAIVDWGPSVSSVYTNGTSGDPGLMKYLAAQSGSTADIAAVLAQYMDTTSHNAANQDTYGGQYQISPSVTSSTIYDSQISSELVSQIQAGNLPRPAGNGLGTIYLVLFPAGDTECIDAQTCSGSNFCAYHSSAVLPDGTNVLYAVLPDNTTGPMAQGCGNAPTLLDDQTSYLSHEWAETVTDPLGNAWWDSATGGTGNEVGDWCNQHMVRNGGWTVQEEWSNIDNNCVGAEPAYAAPNASFLASSTALPGQTVSFDAAGSSDPAQNHTAAAFSGTSYSIASGIASYRWSWGDGTSDTTASTPATNHVFSSPGTYQVSLTVTDNLGFASTVTHPLTVQSGASIPPTATTGAAGAVDHQGAALSGQVNPEGQTVTYQFSYGTSPSSLSHATPATSGPAGFTAQPVSATLSGLQPSTTYYYQLVVQTSDGSSFDGAVESFTTSSPPPPPAPPAPPQVPTVSTGTATGLATSAATLNGALDPGGAAPVTYWFAYGTSPSSLSESTPSAVAAAGSTAAALSAQLSGLQPGTTYYYELVGSLAGTTYTGEVSSFTTAVPAPTLAPGSASAITSSTATIGATITPNGATATYFVEFGPTTAYGHSTPALAAGAGSTPVSVSIALAGLRPRTTYHYRVVASGPGGNVVGPDATFSTARAPAKPPRFGFRAPRHLRPPAILARRVKVRFRCSKACSVRFVVSTSSPSLARTGSVPLTLARGEGHLGKRGAGATRLVFIPHLARGLIRRHHRLRLVISAYAVSAGSAPSAPKASVISVS